MDINYKELFEKSSIENIKLKDEIKNYTEEINQLKEHLKKYTAPKRNKTYYENHKDEIKEKVKEYKSKSEKKLPPEKIKEYNKKAYEKRKQKLGENTNENISE